MKCSCFEPNRQTFASFTKRVVEKLGEGKYDLSNAKYVDTKTPIMLHCNDCGEKFDVSPIMFMDGRKKCACFRLSTCLPMNTDRWIAQSKEIHGDSWDYSESVYVNNRTKIKIICPKHGPFMMLPYNHMGNSNQNGCKICSGDILRAERHLGNEEFIRRAREKFGDKFNYDLVDYIKGEKKVLIGCPDHGIIEMSPYSHLKSKHGCNECSWVAAVAEKNSSGENSVRGLLEGWNIEYKPEHSYPDCVSTRLLHFDFYLPLYNILIEYDGKQHYESVEFFGGDEGLKSSQLRDAIKTKYCEDNNIPLIRIRYDVPDIREYLIQELSRYIPSLVE